MKPPFLKQNHLMMNLLQNEGFMSFVQGATISDSIDL